MTMRGMYGRIVSATALACTFALICGLGARAQGTVEPDAQAVLSAMSKHLGGLKSFSVEFAATDEVTTTDGQKLQFLHSGKILVQRPKALYVFRQGAAGTSEVFLDGKRLTLFGRRANAYVQFDATSIEAAIAAVHGIGLDAPGADLLAERPLDNSTTDIVSGSHIGMSFVDGVPVHQLAFRGKEVDWQLWVTVGEKPLPLRYVITTKSVAGAPQYTLQLRAWNVSPQANAARFAFSPPAGATRLDPASVTANAIGDLTIKRP